MEILTFLLFYGLDERKIFFDNYTLFLPKTKRCDHPNFIYHMEKFELTGHHANFKTFVKKQKTQGQHIEFSLKKYIIFMLIKKLYYKFITKSNT